MKIEINGFKMEIELDGSALNVKIYDSMDKELSNNTYNQSTETVSVSEPVMPKVDEVVDKNATDVEEPAQAQAQPEGDSNQEVDAGGDLDLGGGNAQAQPNEEVNAQESLLNKLDSYLTLKYQFNEYKEISSTITLTESEIKELSEIYEKMCKNKSKYKSKLKEIEMGDINLDDMNEFFLYCNNKFKIIDLLNLVLV